MTRGIVINGFILKKLPLLNRDLLITIFSDQYGKIIVLGKGIRSITSRRLPNIETSNLIKAVIHKKNDRYFLGETNLISGFSQIKDFQSKAKCLYSFLFFLERILPENQKEEQVFKLCKLFLIDLARQKNATSVLNKYLNKIIQQLGYQIEDYNLPETLSVIEDIINEKMPSINI